MLRYDKTQKLMQRLATGVSCNEEMEQRLSYTIKDVAFMEALLSTAVTS